MKNQKGVTLVYLVATIIILIILASVTVTASLNSYKMMKFETVKAEMEEIQEAVMTMIEDYALLKSNDDKISGYVYTSDEDYGYFYKKFGTVKTAATSSDSGVSTIVSKYNLEYTEYLFYFDQDEIKNYFGLEVSIESILVDFSTGIVYNTDGFKDEESNVYYTVEEAGGESIIKNSNSDETITATVSPDSGSLSTSGNTSLLKVTLTLEDSSYPIKKAYYSIDGGSNYIEVDYLGDCEYSDYTVSFVIYDIGTYYFKIENTAGQTTSVIDATYEE